MLPSVDSRLAWRVILLRISTARPVSVLLWIVLRNFLPPASGCMVRTTKMGKRKRERHKMTHGWSIATNRWVRLSQTPLIWQANPRGVKETTPKPLNHSSPQCAPQRPTLCTEENMHSPFCSTLQDSAPTGFWEELWWDHAPPSNIPCLPNPSLVIQDDSWLPPLAVPPLILTQRPWQPACGATWRC